MIEKEVLPQIEDNSCTEGFRCIVYISISESRKVNIDASQSIVKKEKIKRNKELCLMTIRHITFHVKYLEIGK